MKRILFQPFSMEKWFVLGFTAWLATLLNGSGGGGGSSTSYSESHSAGSMQDVQDEVMDTFQAGQAWVMENLALVIIIGSILVLVVLVIYLALSWVWSRGKFMFLDNVANNRALVKAPWSEFKAQGNSLFVWMILYGIVASFVLLALIGVGILIVPLGGMLEGDFTGTTIASLIGIGLIFFVATVAAGYILMLLDDFVVPLMYRNRIGAFEAWRQFLSLHWNSLGSFILYALWKILLSLVAGVAIIALGFATCCIGFILMAIPYLGAVILLPMTVFFRCLSLEFLRQFGPDFDVFPAPAQVPMHPHAG